MVRASFAVAAALAVAGASCSLLLRFDPEGLPCDRQDACLESYACVDGGCRRAAGDAGHRCDGAKSAIPEASCENHLDDDCDGLADCEDPDCTGATCREAAGDCDEAERCALGACPPEGYRAAGKPCRDGGTCDLPEYCTGAAAECPADRLAPPGLECRQATGPCDPAEQCSGSAAECPEDLFLSSGSPCADDGNPCTADLCSAAGACEHRNLPEGTVCEDHGLICGRPSRCKVCRAGACSLNSNSYASDCVPYCGEVGSVCGTSVACCGTQATCPVADYTTYDCPRCCQDRVTCQ